MTNLRFKKILTACNLWEEGETKKRFLKDIKEEFETDKYFTNLKDFLKEALFWNDLETEGVEELINWTCKELETEQLSFDIALYTEPLVSGVIEYLEDNDKYTFDIVDTELSELNHFDMANEYVTAYRELTDDERGKVNYFLYVYSDKIEGTIIKKVLRSRELKKFLQSNEKTTTIDIFNITKNGSTVANFCIDLNRDIEETVILFSPALKLGGNWEKLLKWKLITLINA